MLRVKYNLRAPRYLRNGLWVLHTLAVHSPVTYYLGSWGMSRNCESSLFVAASPGRSESEGSVNVQHVPPIIPNISYSSLNDKEEATNILS